MSLIISGESIRHCFECNYNRLTECPHCRKALSAKQLIRLGWLDDFLKKSSKIQRLSSSSSAESVPESVPDEEENIWVEVLGEGIKKAWVGEKASFTVKYSGSLGIETKGPAKLELQCDGEI